MDKMVKLSVYGITLSQVRDGLYALLLAEENGNRRIPVIIGISEAQSIARVLEQLQPPRPLTHDLFVSFSHAFGARLEKVFIYKFEDGVFFSELTFSNDDMQVVLDSRTSDAVALALRTDAPIYTTQEVLDLTGIVISNDNSDISDSQRPVPAREVSLDRYTIETLEDMMARAVEKENYERAAEIKAVIEQKRSDNQ